MALLCLCCAWTFLGLTIWKFWTLSWEGLRYVQRLHQIPCSRCAYFTGDYRLKCTVHPCKALTERAIACVDFEPKPWTSCQNLGLHVK